MNCLFNAHKQVSPQAVLFFFDLIVLNLNRRIENIFKCTKANTQVLLLCYFPPLI